jgi:Ribbon-helix-helix protein, copG family
MPQMARRKLTSFVIDPELSAGLKAIKERNGISESEQIRRAIRGWLEDEGVLKSPRKRAGTRKRG